MSQNIELTIDENGSCRVEVNGMTGLSCKEATKALEKALGMTAGQVLKPEAYQTAPQQQKAIQ